MYLSARTISSQAKINIKGYRWSAIVAVVLPIMLAALVDFILSFIFTNEIISIIITFTTSTIAAYMTTKMVLELIKGSYQAQFSESLKPLNILVAFIGISVLFFLIQELISLVLGQFFLNSSSFGVLLEDLDNLSSREIIPVLVNSIPYILISLIITTVIETKFFSAKYLVVEGTGIINALKTSWKYTNGYFFGIIKVHLLFLVYVIVALVLLFLGILITAIVPFFAILILIAFLIWSLFFFLPHYTYALGHLHLFLRAANGNPNVYAKRTTLDIQTDSTFLESDEPKDVEKDETDTWDF